jgi:hypothetical protein
MNHVGNDSCEVLSVEVVLSSFLISDFCEPEVTLVRFRRLRNEEVLGDGGIDRIDWLCVSLVSRGR